MRRRPGMPVAAVTVLLGAALGAWLAFAGGLPGSGRTAGTIDGIPVERLQPRELIRVVPAEGVLRAVRATPVSVPAGSSGRFRIGWMAQDGIRVRAGDVVVRFDPAEIEEELQRAADDLASARLEAEKRQVESLAEIRKLESDLGLAQEELRNAREFQKKDETIFSRGEIIESEIDEELARRRQAHVEGRRRTRETLSGAEMELLGIRMRQAEAQIRRARQALASLSVAAPHDGVLVIKRNHRGEAPRVGDTVWSGQVLAEIPDPSRMEAEVFVLEADAGGLAPGKPATVVLESRPEVEHAARIARVEALAKPRFRGSPVQYFGVVLALDRTDSAVMKPGQRVRARLRLEERQEALTVPRQAVFQREGETQVYRKLPGAAGFEAVEVVLGPAGAGRVVVESGLSPGDVVALAEPSGRARPEGGAAGEPSAGVPARPAA